jgi:hypothetical protein
MAGGTPSPSRPATRARRCSSGRRSTRTQQTPDKADLWAQRDAWYAWLLERGCDAGYSKTATSYLEWWKQVLRGKSLGTAKTPW